jgi:hypothetical protein
MFFRRVHRIVEKDEIKTKGFGPFFGDVAGIIESIESAYLLLLPCCLNAEHQLFLCYRIKKL